MTPTDTEVACVGTNMIPNDIRVASVDLQEIAPIKGVSFVMGDITTKKTA